MKHIEPVRARSLSAPTACRSPLWAFLVSSLALLGCAGSSGPGPEPEPKSATGSSAPAETAPAGAPTVASPPAASAAERIATAAAEAPASPPPVAAPQAVEPVEPPEPPYDLAADLEERKRVARAALGAKVRLEVVDDVFLVVGDRSMTRYRFKRSLKMIRKTLVAYQNERFSTLPDRAVGVYLFDKKRPYQKYCKKHYGGCGTPFGVYFRDDRRMVMNVGPGLGTLTHELVHPIVEVDFPQAPEWINEGIASLFERPRYPKPGHIKGITNWRLPRLRDAVNDPAERDLTRIDRMLAMSDAEFRGAHEDLHYSMGRYLCQWLDEQKLLWPFYRSWRDNHGEDPTGAKTFAAVVGKAPAEAQDEWVRWIKRQRVR